MSSLPTPNTSVEAAPLCTSRPKKRENSSLFPSIATLNLFRKKPPSRPSSPVEPYEVAPGIWSTDATARVFGYLDTDDKRAKSRVQGAEPDIQAPSQKVKRKPVPIKGPLSECEQARIMENTDTIRDEAEASTRFRQEQKHEERIKRRSNWPGARRGRMWTVSRDDQLVERGANPRTGLVSPFVVSDNSDECVGGDYIAGGKVGPAGPSPARRTRSGKWKQDSLGWSLVESPLLSPIAQSMSDKLSRAVSIKQLEDRLLVEMPGVDNPDPDNMTDEQIRNYQEGIAQAYRHGGGSLAMLNPDMLPSPRRWTPEGPSTSPIKLHKIPRKEVGSRVVRKGNSGDTVIINANSRASSLPTPRKDIMKRQKVGMKAPSNTPKGSSLESCADIISNSMRKTDPFLGRRSRLTCSQTASATQSQSYLSSLSSGQAHQCLQNESKSNPSPTLSDPSPTSPTLVQYIPHMRFPHPSHFANLETSSYHRPTQLLPARLRPLGQQRQTVEDVCTTTFTTTSIKGPKQEQRPKMQRQEGNSVVPRVNPIFLGRERPLDGYCQGGTPRNKQAYPSANSADTLHTSGLVTGRSRAVGPIEKADPARGLAETRYQRKTSMPADCLRQPPCENRQRNLASPTHMTQGLGLGSANVARERIQRHQSGGGCTPTYGHRGNDLRALPGVRHQCIADDKEQATLPADLTTGGDSRTWFAGQWAEVEEETKRSDSTASMQEEILTHRRSVSKKAADVKLWLYAAEAWVESLPKLGSIQQLLHRMIGHVMRTMHHASPALTTLRTANGSTRDYFRAIKDLALAAVYLLVLLNLFMVLRKVLVFVGKMLYWFWHPVQTIIMIVGWCVVG